MTGENPFDPSEGFGGLPFFGDMAAMFGSMSGSGWEQARQIAIAMATGNETEPNVEPAERIAFEQIARVAELHVVQATGLNASTTGSVSIRPATKREWASATVDHHREILERIGASMGKAVDVAQLEGEELDASDPAAAMMQSLLGMLGPMMLNMTAGTMVGHLAQRSLGFHDLPIPRGDLSEILVVDANVKAFTEEWSLPADDVRLWVCLNELTHLAVLRVPHIRARFASLLDDYAGNFQSDPRAFEGAFGDLDLSDPTSLQSLQETMGDPDVVLGAMQSDRQREVLPYLSAMASLVEGYVDHIMDTIGGRLIGSYGAMSEALRRRRITADPSDRFVGQMFGLTVDQACYERGQAFVAGVIERADADRLDMIFRSEANLPTPAEIDAPGLWLARLEIDEIEPAGDTEFPDQAEPPDVSD